MELSDEDLLRVIQIKLNQPVYENVRLLTNLLMKRRYVTLTTISRSFTHNMAATTSWNEIASLSPWMYVYVIGIVRISGLVADILVIDVSSVIGFAFDQPLVSGVSACPCLRWIQLRTVSRLTDRLIVAVREATDNEQRND